MNLKRILPTIPLFVIATSVQAQRISNGGPPSMTGVGNVPERINTPSVPAIEGLPQAVKVGLTVYISGMVPVDSAGGLIAASDIPGQARQVMKNLVAVIRAARGVPGDLVQLTVYLRDPSPSTVSAMKTAIIEAVGKENAPAVTILGTTALPEASMQVMVSGTAQLRSEFPDRTRN